MDDSIAEMDRFCEKMQLQWRLWVLGGFDINEMCAMTVAYHVGLAV